MRSEQEMLDLIINTARQDERIRAVHLNGSRANPSAPRDFFQDFDVVYFVTEVAPFKDNLEWISRFGKLMILQMPDAMEDPPPLGGDHFTYLMQFSDGNRIDLSIYPLSRLDELEQDSLTIVLLDKDGIFDAYPLPDERAYMPQPPTAKAFADCTNEFWWVCPYIAKGLWRKEILYARSIFDEVVRPQLMKMLTWFIGLKTNFSVNPGKLGKFFQNYLAPELWERLLQTYSDADYDRTWQALFTMTALFRQVALAVAERFGFEYPHEDDRRVSAHLEHVRHLSRDAETMY